MPAPVEHNARTVALLTMVSRVTGLVREAVLSRLFGAGGLMDAFFFAFMLPNLFRRLFGEGALAAAFLPEYAARHREDPEIAARLASVVIAALLMGLGALVLAGEIVLWILGGRTGPDGLVIHLMMITLPYMPLVCAVAVLGAMLHVHGRFGPTATAPIILNLCMIATAGGMFALVRDERVAIIATAASVVAAGVLQVGWSVLALRRHRWWRTPRLSGVDVRSSCRRILLQAGPMILGLGVLQVNTFFDGVIASYPVTFGSTIFGVPYPLEEGAMAAISFAQRLYQFPLGVFGIAVATAIYPVLATQADDPAAFTATLRRGIRLVLFIGLPASCGLILVRDPLTAVVLQGGQFGGADTRRVSDVLLWYAPAVWAYSMVAVLTRAFYARRDAMTPVRIAVGFVLLNLALNCTLIWTPLAEAGLALSTAICSTLQTLTLFVVLRRRVPGMLDAEVLGSWLRTGAITAAMVAVLLALGTILPAADTWTGAVVALAAVVVAGTVFFAATSIALRMPELRWLISRKRP